MAVSAAPFGRIITAMVTPFQADGAIDHQEAAKLAQYLIANGSDGLVLAGSTGESVTLSSDEKIALFETVRAAVGDQAKVLGGVGSPSTAESIEMTARASKLGLDGLLVVTPAYNKPSQEGLYQHFSAVADASALPIMLYNVPGRTSVNMEPETVLRLADRDNIKALKEAGAFAQAGVVAANSPEGFAVYCGADEVNLPVLALGGVGIVSVISHVVGPDLQRMVQAFFEGDLATARALHDRTLAMTRAMFSAPNPVPTKTALTMLDVLPSDRVRLPLVEAGERERAGIHAALKQYGLL